MTFPAQPEAQSVLEERMKGSKDLYLLFGGLIGRIGMPPFEFYKSAQILTENRIFVRDLNQTWYQNGLSGISRDIPETADFLREKIRSYSPERLYFVGNSMGGFGACLFANLLNMGHIIAFSPQTFISRWKRLRHGDGRWSSDVAETYKSTISKRRYFDLSKLPPAAGSVTCDLFVSAKDRLDMIHARNIARRPNVNLHVFDTGGHSLVKKLRDSGALAAILKRSYKAASAP